MHLQHGQLRPDCPACQQGSVIVIFAITLTLLVVLLGSIQVGYVAWMKRELQKAADLAALSAVQSLQNGDEARCASAQAAAQALADANFPGSTATTVCGRWQPKPHPVAGAGNKTSSHFSAGVQPYNALRVRAEKPALTLFPFTHGNPVSAVAVAANSEPVAAFSVGSRLLSLNSKGLIAKLLEKSGLRTEQLKLLDADGLANIRITPAGLLQELGIPVNTVLAAGSREGLVELESVQVADFLEATLVAINRSATTQLNVEAMQALIGAILEVPGLRNGTHLGKDIKLLGPGGIFAMVATSDRAAALDTQISAADVLAAGLLIANGQHAIKLPVDLNIGLASAKLDAYVVAPPTLAIGGPGTTARNAQLRLDLDLTVRTLSNLRVALEVATSSATVENICRAPLQANQASFSGHTELLRLCLLKPDAAPNASCEDNDPDEDVTLLKLLGFPIKTALSKNLLPLDSGGVPPFELRTPPEAPSMKTMGGSSISTNYLISNLLRGIFEAGRNTATGHYPENPSAKEVTGKFLENFKVLGRSWKNASNGLEKQLEEYEKDVRKFNDRGLLVGALDSLLQVVTGVVGGVVKLLGSLLGTLGSLFTGGCFGELCKKRIIDELSHQMFGSSYENGLLTLLLGPLFAPLDLILNHLTEVLGLDLTQSDVTLHSLQCGMPMLVE